MEIKIGKLRISISYGKTDVNGLDYITLTPRQKRRYRKLVLRSVVREPGHKIIAIKTLRSFIDSKTGKLLGLREAKELVERWGY